jgi:hypothetical protein
MATPRIEILSDPDERGQFAYRLTVLLPSGRLKETMRDYPGPLPTGTPAQIKQAIKQDLQQAWQDYKAALKDVRLEGATQDDQGNWNL